MTTYPRFFIGIDGGGTSCRGILCWRDESVCLHATAGPANVLRHERAMESAFSVLHQLAAKADLTVAGLAAGAIHLGMAGVLTKADAKRVEAAIESRFSFGAMSVSDDQVTTIEGALGGQRGAVAAIGTGSFVGRKSEVLRMIGGWGSIVGDQASGAYLGRRLLQECLLAHDGLRAQSKLSRDMMALYGDLPAEVVAFAHKATPAEFASFAPNVVHAAADGDLIAVELLREGAAYIARAIDVLDWKADEPICLVGGIGPQYRQWLPMAMAAAVVAPRGNALDGALLMASKGGML